MSFAPQASHSASALRFPPASGRGYEGLPRLLPRLAEVGEGNYLSKTNRVVLKKVTGKE